MFFDSKNSKECYDCGACIDICPKGAISIKEGVDTYLYPEIDDSLCIKCNACRRICPIQNNLNSTHMPQKCFAAIAKSSKDWESSSSGGAFRVIANFFLEECNRRKQCFYVAGAIWKDDLKVVHDVSLIRNIGEIEIFQKSKYVKSNCVGIYKKIKALLLDPNNFVLFTGTPCQIQALKNFLTKKDGIENLVCIDIVCHGVPSQKIFDKYIEGLENEMCLKVVGYEFKNKKKLDNGTIYTRSARISFSDGSERLVTRFSDDYINLFYTCSFHFRPSCYTCKFKSPHRVGDITLGDAWGLEKIYENVKPIQGISLIIFNKEFEKLQEYIAEKMTTYSCDYDFMVQSNGPLRECTGNGISEKILQDFFSGIRNDSKSFKTVAEDYIKSINEFKGKSNE